jgi:hypothetical protein
MKELVAAAMLVALAACSKSDDVRESVTGPKTAPDTNTSAPMSAATPSEVPNSVAPDDVQLGGGIRH